MVEAALQRKKSFLAAAGTGGRQVRARGDAADSAGHEFLGGVGVAVAN